MKKQKIENRKNRKNRKIEKIENQLFGQKSKNPKIELLKPLYSGSKP